MAVIPEVKLFGKWSSEEIEVGSLLLTMLCKVWGERRVLVVVNGFLPPINALIAPLELLECFLVAGDRHLSGGLHRREGKVCHLRAAHSRKVPEEAVQEGAVPDC